jgi:hypothetical protein
LTLEATRSICLDELNGSRERMVRLVPVLAAFGLVAGLAAAQGGYFATAWGWASVPLFWTAAVALAVREEVRLSRAEGIFLGGLLAFAAWLGVSAAWSIAPAESVLEVERALVYTAAAVGVLATSRARSSPHVLGALLAAISVIAAFSLATRLLPDRVGIYDGTGIYRLAQPIGYWNGLALFAAVGVLLALGFAARAGSIAIRAAAAAVLVMLLPTLYFTFGRGAWIALAAGLIATAAVDPRRLQFLSALVVLAPLPAAAVLIASRERGLTRGGSRLADAARDGHRVAILLVLLALGNAVLSAGLAIASHRVRVGRTGRRAFSVGLVALVLASGSLLLIRHGGPVHIVERAYASFKAPLPRAQGNLNRRLLSFSGNGRAQLWGLAWDEAGAHPLLGAGAGGYERYFLVHQPTDVSLVRDAHSLYVETLAEVGPLGLALLVTVLAAPLAALPRARTHPLVPAAAGGYVAYLVHTGVDWDWELPAVTLAGLLCGVVILLAARSSAPVSLRPRLRWSMAAVAVAAAFFATVGLLGNTALSRSTAAHRHGDEAAAARDARRARLLMPWSPAPWEALGRAQLAAGLVSDARRSFRKALSIDSGDWSLWYDLSRVAKGSERSRALDEVSRLFPQSGLTPLTRQLR